MLTDPSDRYHFLSFDGFLEGLRAARVALGAVVTVDTKGRLRVATSTGQVCCPLTLTYLYVTGEQTPVERVARIITKKERPLMPPHLAQVILAASENHHVAALEGKIVPAFERDVQLELDAAAGINGKRRRSKRLQLVAA